MGDSLSYLIVSCTFIDRSLLLICQSVGVWTSRSRRSRSFDYTRAPIVFVQNSGLFSSIHLANTPYWTKGADRFVKNHITILSLPWPGTVRDLHHVSFDVFMKYFVDRVVTLL